MNYKKIGIIVADMDEYRPFAESIKNKSPYDCFNMQAITFSSNKKQVIAVCSGIGKVNAATAAAFLAANGCDAMLNFGLSGGLCGVKKGEFILPEFFAEHDFDLTGIGYKPCQKPNQEYVYKADKALLAAFFEKTGIKVGGTAVSGDSFICDEEKKEQLKSLFCASSCDMETAAIASVCNASNIPFAALRRISDDADGNAADNYREVNRNEGKTLSETFFDCLAAIGIESGEER